MPRSLTISQKSCIYASKTLLGGLICYFTLIWAGVANPIWAVITVTMVSDPDITTTRSLVYTRILNTTVGCIMGLLGLWVIGYSPIITIATAAATVLVITSIRDYPNNWRLAPVTVIIVMDAARLAHGHDEQLHYALLRGGEIIFGSAVALFLAMIYTRLLRMKTVPAGEGE